jgi:hypothetical protein
MSVRIFALGLVCAACLFGQRRRFSWEDLCFKNPGAPVCRGNDYAVKPPPKNTAPRTAVTNPFPSASPGANPSLIVLGGIDWRFADPYADALIGFNFSAFAASPLALDLIAQLEANQGLTEPDMQRILAGPSGVDQIAISVHNNRIVAMLTGRVTDSALPPSEAGFKAITIPGNAMLIGHAADVDQAAYRIAAKGPLSELARLAVERQLNGEFWAVGSAGFAGPQALHSGVKRFYLTVSIRDRLSSDVAFEFDAAPGADALRMWQTTLGAVALEGNAVHARMTMEAGEMQQRFSPIAASPLGQRLAALIKAAQYLPAADTTAPKHTKPMIYGLDGGPKELNQGPNR